ncbi:MAG: Lon protease family protein [Anaerolineae bacterium]
MAIQELTSDQVRRPCDPELLDFETTAELEPLAEIIGQPRAVKALDLGVGIASHGFNVFAFGLPGSGKTTLITQFLEQRSSDEPVPDDFCYVTDFENPRRPRILRLPAGQGRELRDDMQTLVENLRQDIPRAFESEEFQEERKRVTKEIEKQQETIFQELQEKAKVRAYALVRTPVGLLLVPALNGEPLTERQYEALDKETKTKLERLREELSEEVDRGMRRIRELEKEARARVRDLERQIAMLAVGHHVDELRTKYGDLSEVVEYLEGAREDVVEHVDAFRDDEPATEGLPPALRAAADEQQFVRYAVNVIIDNAETEGAPVVVETNPNYGNLVGRIEHRALFGALVTDLSMIEPGALHRANGGYLILNALDVLTSPYAWQVLKRSLKSREIRTESLGEQLSLVSTVSLEPEPIPLNVKVVLIGSPLFYYLLHTFDEDFPKLFKVQADFGPQMDRTPEAERQYGLFVRTLGKEEDLPTFDRTAVARLVEHSSRIVGDQEKLSTRFGPIADLVREAAYYAGQNGHEVVTGDDVRQAIEAGIFRRNRIEERIREMIADGTLIVQTEGEEVGQVNGLAVLQLGDYAFGKPSRVTARTYMGRGNVVNIEREVELSGPIHSKGVLILGGYLGGQYGTDTPLTLSASLVFEQSYEEVEGDSASSAELYALLSSLSGFPLRQDLAVTGSVDQRGRIQTVGGVTEKIEGFFDVCREAGLTGEQGVMIPAGNLRHLMLRDDVVQAVREGGFHIYAVETVDEGLELLTGQPAGERGPDGTFPEGTIHRAVIDRLSEWATTLKEFGRDEEGAGDETGD